MDRAALLKFLPFIGPFHKSIFITPDDEGIPWRPVNWIIGNGWGREIRGSLPSCKRAKVKAARKHAQMTRRIRSRRARA